MFPVLPKAQKTALGHCLRPVGRVGRPSRRAVGPPFESSIRTRRCGGEGRRVAEFPGFPAASAGECSCNEGPEEPATDSTDATDGNGPPRPTELDHRDRFDRNSAQTAGLQQKCNRNSDGPHALGGGGGPSLVWAFTSAAMRTATGPEALTFTVVGADFIGHGHYFRSFRDSRALLHALSSGGHSVRSGNEGARGFDSSQATHPTWGRGGGHVGENSAEGDVQPRSVGAGEDEGMCPSSTSQPRPVGKGVSW